MPFLIARLRNIPINLMFKIPSISWTFCRRRVRHDVGQKEIMAIMSEVHTVHQLYGCLGGMVRLRAGFFWNQLSVAGVVRIPP